MFETCRYDVLKHVAADAVSEINLGQLQLGKKKKNCYFGVYFCTKSTIVHLFRFARKVSGLPFFPVYNSLARRLVRSRGDTAMRQPDVRSNVAL